MNKLNTNSGDTSKEMNTIKETSLIKEYKKQLQVEEWRNNGIMTPSSREDEVRVQRRRMQKRPS